MFDAKKKDSSSSNTINTSVINTIIGSNTKIDGTLTASESARIDGTLVGKIVSERSIIVGQSGTVRGDITAVEILVAGTVYGDLIAQEKIEMTSTGRVVGSITSRSLVIDEGAVLKGTSNMDVSEDELAEISSTSAEVAAEQKTEKTTQEK